jgi:hypothetical protein
MFTGHVPCFSCLLSIPAFQEKKKEFYFMFHGIEDRVVFSFTSEMKQKWVKSMVVVFLYKLACPKGSS